jgi:hypothetical protein
MGNIAAVMQYDEDGLPWLYRMETIWRLAGCHGVEVRVQRKSPEREPEYYSITVSADEMLPIQSFITSLFTHIGAADSPIFYVRTKNRHGLPGLYRRLVKTPTMLPSGIEC